MVAGKRQLCVVDVGDIAKDVLARLLAQPHTPAAHGAHARAVWLAAAVAQWRVPFECTVTLEADVQHKILDQVLQNH